MQGWWRRRSALDARKRTRTCIIAFGNAVPTQVRSLRRHSISFKKPHKPTTHWNVSNSGSWCHDPGFGNGALYIHLWDGSGTHSDPRIRRVGWAAVIIQGMSNCLGQTLECWKRHSERLMSSLRPVWAHSVRANPMGRAELMACVVAAESTRGNVVYITEYEILKKRQDRSWPTPRLGQGGNPDLWWRMSRALKSRQGTFTVQ